MKRLLILIALLASATPAYAQPISQYNFRVYNAGAPAPLQGPQALPLGSVTCNLAPPAVAAYTQPKTVVFDDPAFPPASGKVCIFTDPGTGLLFSVPFGGTYEGTLTAVNSAGESGESNRGPFTRPGSKPGVPTNVRIGG